MNKYIISQPLISYKSKGNLKKQKSLCLSNNYEGLYYVL